MQVAQGTQSTGGTQFCDPNEIGTKETEIFYHAYEADG